MIRVYFFLNNGAVVKIPLTRFEKMHGESFHHELEVIRHMVADELKKKRGRSLTA